MAKLEELTVDVKAHWTVSRSTAEACLKMVEMYVNDTGKVLVGNRQPDGTLQFELVERTTLTATARDAVTASVACDARETVARW